MQPVLLSVNDQSAHSFDSGCFVRTRHNAFQIRLLLQANHRQIIFRLEVCPKTFAGAEIFRQTRSRVSGDAAPPVNNIQDAGALAGWVLLPFLLTSQSHVDAHDSINRRRRSAQSDSEEPSVLMMQSGERGASYSEETPV